MLQKARGPSAWASFLHSSSAVGQHRPNLKLVPLSDLNCVVVERIFPPAISIETQGGGPGPTSNRAGVSVESHHQVSSPRPLAGIFWRSALAMGLSDPDMVLPWGRASLTWCRSPPGRVFTRNPLGGADPEPSRVCPTAVGLALEAGDQDKTYCPDRPVGRFTTELTRGIWVRCIRCSPKQPSRVEARARKTEKRLDKRRASPKVGRKGRT